MNIKILKQNISRLRRSLKSILRHPLTQKNKIGALWRYFTFHTMGRLKTTPSVFPFVGNVKFIASPGMAGIVGNIYKGLEDFAEQTFLLHFLRPGDLFVDVGANVGSYSLLASGFCGAESLSIEPIPSTFKKLSANIQLNNLEGKMKGLNLGVGSKKEKLTFTTEMDVLNRVVVDNDPLNQSNNIMQVDVLPLDDLLAGKSPILIKVDVEGYEEEVIRGASSVLNSSNLHAILIETSGYENRYGFSYENVHKKLLEFGFIPYTYFPFERRFEMLDTFNHHKFNTLYIRDMESVVSRIKSAKPITLLKSTF